MNRIDELLAQKKHRLDRLEVPEDMEKKLYNALLDQPQPRRSKFSKIVLAAACIILLIAATQSSTLANYGKRLLGYDQVMSGTLKDLNTLGKGQVIKQSCRFKNGAAITLDGLFLDDNQLILYYTLKDLKSPNDQPTFMEIKGRFKTYAFQSSVGFIKPAGNEVQYEAHFEPPGFGEKNLSLCYNLTVGGQAENGAIKFKLDRKQAMGHILKKKIHKSVAIDGQKISFDAILASPTTTVVEGTIQQPWELAKEQLTGERIRPQGLNLELAANGKKIPTQGTGISTGMNGTRFRQEWDALPIPLNDLEIRVKGFVADHKANKKIKINKTAAQSYQIMGQDINIMNVRESNGDTYLTLSSQDTVKLTKVYLLMDGKKSALEDTSWDEYLKKSNGTIVHTRTLHFKGVGQQLELNIVRMAYQSECREIIRIPVDD